ncbi:hypothetical protein GEMRC1_007302 [Eukaryota sp. GEM-RC1]
MSNLILFFLLVALCWCSSISFSHRYLEVVIEDHKQLSFFVSAPNSPAHTHYYLNALYLTDSPSSINESLDLSTYVWTATRFNPDPIDEVTYKSVVHGKSSYINSPELTFTVSAQNLLAKRSVQVEGTFHFLSPQIDLDPYFVFELVGHTTHKKTGNHIKYREAKNDPSQKLVDFGYSKISYSTTGTNDMALTMSQSRENHYIYYMKYIFTMKDEQPKVVQNWHITPEVMTSPTYMKNIVIIVGIVFVIGALVAVIVVNKMTPPVRNQISLDLEELDVPLV